MNHLNIFTVLDRAVDACLYNPRPTHILLGAEEMTALRNAFRALGTEITGHSAMHRGLYVIPVELPSLIQLGTLHAPHVRTQ
jgi:hypothetical protein